MFSTLHEMIHFEAQVRLVEDANEVIALIQNAVVHDKDLFTLPIVSGTSMDDSKKLLHIASFLAGLEYIVKKGQQQTDDIKGDIDLNLSNVTSKYNDTYYKNISSVGNDKAAHETQAWVLLLTTVRDINADDYNKTVQDISGKLKKLIQDLTRLRTQLAKPSNKANKRLEVQ